MKILIYLEQEKILNIMKKKKQPNPGVGGTTFTAARLALSLQEEIETFGYDIRIFLTTKCSNFSLFHGIEVIPLNQIKFFNFDCSIITGDLINDLYEKIISINSKRFISCIRHPYDYDKIWKSKKIKSEIVSVSEACYLSNFLICGTHNQIDNIFNAKIIRDSLSVLPKSPIDILKKTNANDHETFRVGYMGALVSSKGFHLVAKNWSKISEYCKKNNQKLKLEVIGGSELYEFEESHKTLPCSKVYGDLIQKYLGDKINKSVFFHGTLGPERYQIMNKCDIAIVNPNGDGESFCTSILEWFSLGVPVISSLNYGTSDYMKYFEELTISNPSQISNRIIKFLKYDKNKVEKLKLRSFLMANYYSSKELLNIQKWLLLINKSNIFVNRVATIKVYLYVIKNFIKVIRNLLLNLIVNFINLITK